MLWLSIEDQGATDSEGERNGTRNWGNMIMTFPCKRALTTMKWLLFPRTKNLPVLGLDVRRKSELPRTQEEICPKCRGAGRADAACATDVCIQYRLAIFGEDWGNIQVKYDAFAPLWSPSHGWLSWRDWSSQAQNRSPPFQARPCRQGWKSTWTISSLHKH